MAIKIIVSAAKIISSAGKINDAIGRIRNFRERMRNLREQDLNDAWNHTHNADSNIFSQRMQEMDTDIQKMIEALDEYEAVLRRSAQEFEQKQATVAGEAQGLRSPRNR